MAQWKKDQGGWTYEFTYNIYTHFVHRFIERRGNQLEPIAWCERENANVRTDACICRFVRRFEDRLVTADRPTDRTGAKAVGESRMPVIDIN